MTRPRTTVEIAEGVKVELLFTPSMYAIARRRGMRIEADRDDPAQVMMAYTELMYLAALNAHEVRLYDDPSLGEFPYRLIDFVEWSAVNPDEFSRVLDLALRCVLGKGIDDLKKEEAAKGEDPEPEEVKKN